MELAEVLIVGKRFLIQTGSYKVYLACKVKRFDHLSMTRTSPFTNDHLKILNVNLLLECSQGNTLIAGPSSFITLDFESLGCVGPKV